MKTFDEIFKPVRRGDVTNQLTLKESQEGINFVAQNDTNNGFVKTVSNDEYKVFKGNSIIIGRQTGIAYYQPNDFITTDGVLVLEPLEFDFNRYSGLFFTSVLLKQLQKFGYTNTVSAQKLKELSLCLPYKIKGEKKVIDFYFIKKYIETLEAERIETLEAYLIATNLMDYRLTKNDEKVLDKFAKLSDTKSRVEESGYYAEFRLQDVLKWCSGIKELNPLKLDELYDVNENKYPFYGQATINNGIISYHNLKRDVLNNADGKPTILIHSNNQNIVYLESPFYLKDGHGATSVLQSEKLNRYTAFYLMTATKKVIEKRFNYNAKATKIGLKETEIQLPIHNGEIDYEFMSDFIRAVEKLVIKDLVIWADKKIAATKEVVAR